jgi:hypothetical protein
VILPWSAATLGRFLVPQARVSRDHQLVVDGPFRFLRHPAYSGDLALWLGSALATLNVLLLVLWPFYVLGATMQARVEDGLLEAKFGENTVSASLAAPRPFPRVVTSSEPVGEREAGVVRRGESRPSRTGLELGMSPVVVRSKNRPAGLMPGHGLS